MIAELPRSCRCLSCVAGSDAVALLKYVLACVVLYSFAAWVLS